MAFRKNVPIVELIAEVNRMNRESIVSPGHRAALNSFLEGFLMKYEVYEGFGFLETKDVPAGQKPGIDRDPKNTKANRFPDETRRIYYTSRFLTTTDRKGK